MFLRVLSNRKSIRQNVQFKAPNPILDGGSLSFLNWEEHCVECSPPYCYNNCENYLCRIDKKCIRIKDGIQVVRDIEGPLGYGVRCVFRKWAKIETKWNGQSISLKQNRWRDKYWDIIGLVCLKIAKAISFMSPKLRLYGAYVYYRNQYFKKCKPSYVIPNLLYINCYLFDKESISLMIQIDNSEKIYLTKIIKLTKGENSIKLDLNFQIPLGARIFVTPLEDTDTVILFKWLDVFKGVLPESEEPASKVKVVAWDLDNTLWDGILVNHEGVKLNENAVHVIKELDKRGILNTIVSKNDESEALETLKQFELLDYFLCPAINWGQKSENMKMIAKRLNLGINSFAFIDDNIREREEVRQALPSVRIFAETEIDSILDLKPFDVPITETSRNRRKLYMEDTKRQEIQSSFGDNYDDFLKSLKMSLLSEPINNDNRDRCYELLSRSNQLNLSTNRYTEQEYGNLISDNSYICRAFRVIDTFGDYGIVSFISAKIEENTAVITDFVISCRIAKKKVEQAIIASLRPLLEERNVKIIIADLKITKKNSPLVDVFNQLPFDIKEQNETHILYEMNNISNLKESGIIEIKTI